MLLLWIFVVSPLFINIAANGFGFEQNTNNTSRSSFPLRVPPQVKAVYLDQKKDSRLRRPKRSKSGSKRVKRQLQPGVYSCGHQGIVMDRLTEYGPYEVPLSNGLNTKTHLAS